MKITRGQLRRLILEMNSREEDLIKILMEAIDLIKHVDFNDKPTVEAPLERLDSLKNEGIITNLRFDENYMTVGPGTQWAKFAVHWDFGSPGVRNAVMNYLMTHPQIEAIDVAKEPYLDSGRYYYIPRTDIHFEHNLGDRVVIYAIKPDGRFNVYVVSVERTRFFREYSIGRWKDYHLHPSGRRWNET
jgi:hypothetical protein